MTPLMTLNGDDIMEASLLRPAEGKLGPFLMPEEETSFLGKGDGRLEVPGPTPRHSEIPRFIEPAEQTTTLLPHSQLPGRERSQSKGLMLIPITPVSGSDLICRGIIGSQSGGRNFILLSTLWMGVVMIPTLKVWFTSKLQPSACQPPRSRYMPPTLPGSAGKKRVPWPNRPQDNLGLLDGAEGGDGSTGYCAPEVHYSYWSLPRCVLWGSARAPQVPSPHGGGR